MPAPCTVHQVQVRPHNASTRKRRRAEHGAQRLRPAASDWAEDPELRDKSRKYRPNVERVVSQIANRGGRRLKLSYRGTTKNHAWLSRRTAGLNLRSLIGHGLTRTAGLWALTPAT